MPIILLIDAKELVGMTVLDGNFDKLIVEESIIELLTSVCTIILLVDIKLVSPVETTTSLLEGNELPILLLLKINGGSVLLGNVPVILSEFNEKPM